MLVSGSNVDFNSAIQTATITAGTNSSTVNIAVIDDDIVEGDETFTMNLNVLMLPGITAGAVTMSTATIIDTSSKLCTSYKMVGLLWLIHYVSDQSKVFTKSVHWFRGYRICTSKP